MSTLVAFRRAPGPAVRLCLAVLLAVTAGGCISMGSLGRGPVPEGWTRETFYVSRERCSGQACRSRIGGSPVGLEVRTRTRVHKLHEIPGWEQPRAERAAFSVVGWAIRQAGGYTGHVEVGLGSRIVSASRDADLELRCSLFWIDEVERAFDRRAGVGVVSATERHANGTQCQAVSPADTAEARWRFEGGVAPPLDSLAAVYDALAAEQSPLLGPRPPLLLTRRAVPDHASQIWSAQRSDVSLLAMPRLAIERDGVPVAILHVGVQSTLDLAPGVTDEERALFRLLAAMLAADQRAI